MRLPEPLIAGRLIKRYKRFLADVELQSGEAVTVHCPNSGSMRGLLQAGNEVLLSKSNNPKRKLLFTWELVNVGNTWVGVNTLNPNSLIHEAFVNKQIGELTEYSTVKPEANWGGHSRFDFLLKDGDKQCFVEVKNVTLAENEVALFPDAKTERGTKHLIELMHVVHEGMRGVMCFLVHRDDCNSFKPAEEIDNLYAEKLREASKNGVEILVYRTKIDPPEVTLDCTLEFDL